MNTLATKGMKISLPELCYFIALSYFLIHEMLLTTMIPYDGVSFYFILVLPLLLVKIVFSKYNPYQLLLSLLIIIAGILSWRATGNSYPMKVAFFIAAGRGVQIERIIKCYLGIVVTILLISFFLSISGTIINLVYTRYREGRLFIRQAFGSVYPTNFASHVLYLYLFISYLLREKFGLLLCLTGWGLSYLVYIYNDARFNAIVLVLAATLFYLVSKGRLNRKIASAFTLAFPVLGLGSIVIAKLFVPYNPIWRLLNDLFSNRFVLMSRMMNETSLNLFGQKIRLVGFGKTTQLPETYNYIDNSYFQIALLYGTVFLILILILFTILHRQSLKSENLFLTVLLLTVAISSFVEENLIAASYNILCISFFANFGLSKGGENINDSNEIEIRN